MQIQLCSCRQLQASIAEHLLQSERLVFQQEALSSLYSLLSQDLQRYQEETQRLTCFTQRILTVHHRYQHGPQNIWSPALNPWFRWVLRGPAPLQWHCIQISWIPSSGGIKRSPADRLAAACKKRLRLNTEATWTTWYSLASLSQLLCWPGLNHPHLIQLASARFKLFPNHLHRSLGDSWVKDERERSLVSMQETSKNQTALRGTTAVLLLG